MTREIESKVAIIGLSARTPGARSVEELWALLLEGRTALQRLSRAESDAVDRRLTEHPAYVGVRGRLDDVEGFDVDFWRVTPADARLLDPQQRVFLECCWEALEQAGYATADSERRVGVYGSTYLSTYLLHHLLRDREASAPDAWISIHQGNTPDQLAARVAYHLNLQGPAVSVQTACSSSLVAVHLAYQALLAGECELALAGGVSIVVPQEQGYVPTEGGVLSRDGVCRPFDQRANGTVFSNGAGVVAMKRLADAERDGDFIWAVLCGSAVNNDGREKAAYAAPAADGHERVAQSALGFAGLQPSDIGYIEAHGTGTELGDAVEVSALARLFGPDTRRVLGSVKGHIGHLDNAAGVVSLIKAALAVHHGVIPGTFGYTAPGSKLALHAGLAVTSEAVTWPTRTATRRAAVSALGMGGTNAHAIVEAAALPQPSADAAGPRLLVVSAKSEAALRDGLARLAAHLERHPEVALDAVAYTLAFGRQAFEWRWAGVCNDRDDAIARLRAPELGIRHRAPSPAPHAPAGVSPPAPRHEPAAAGATRDDAARLGSAAEAWLAGAGPNVVQQLWAGRTGRRVALPTYAFQRRRCWVERSPVDVPEPPTASAQRGACYQPVWGEASLEPSPGHGRESWIVYSDESELAAAVVDQLRSAGQIVTLVRRGERFEAPERGVFQLRPGAADEHERLLRETRSLALTPSKIVYLWGQSDDVAAAAEGTFLDLCSLARGLGRFGVTRPMALVAVTRAGQNVLGTETPLPELALLSGLFNAWHREQPHVACTWLDLAGHEAPGRREPERALADAERVVRVCRDGRALRELAGRGARLWMRSFRPLPPAPAGLPFESELDGGVCLISGGLGGIGFGLASELAERARLGFALVQRTALGAAHPASAARRARLDELRRRAAGVETFAADVCDAPALARVVADLRQRGQRIVGAIHAAGVPGRGMLLNLDADGIAAVLAPKLRGARALREALRGEPLRFFALCSSTAAHFGGVGLAEYAAANAFLDAYAEQLRAEGLPACSIGWDTWRELGMAADAAATGGVRPSSLAQHERGRLQAALSTAEAGAAFWRILHHASPSVVVCNDEPNARRSAVVDLDVALGNAGEARVPVARHELTTDYVAPRSSLEEAVVREFERVLGREGVGVSDDFFELGGDSLSATRVVAALRERFRVDLTIVALLSGRTCEEVAAGIELLLIEEAERAPG